MSSSYKQLSNLRGWTVGSFVILVLWRRFGGGKIAGDRLRFDIAIEQKELGLSIFVTKWEFDRAYPHHGSFSWAPTTGANSTCRLGRPQRRSKCCPLFKRLSKIRSNGRSRQNRSSVECKFRNWSQNIRFSWIWSALYHSVCPAFFLLCEGCLVNLLKLPG